MLKKSLLIILFMAFGCTSESARPVFVATSHPVYEIIRELAGTRAEVTRLVEPGDSPHTYQPKPSEMYSVEQSMAMFYVSEHSEPWAEKLPADPMVALLDFVPAEFILFFDEEHSHDDHGHEGHGHDSDDSAAADKHIVRIADPHFWMDPLAVRAMLPRLADTLALLDPDNAATYRSNADLFAKRLTLLDRQVEEILRPHRGKPVFLFHPSFRYMLKRYGLKYMGSIEESPGKEPSPRYIAEISEKIKNSGATSIFTEPQLPEGPAKLIAEEAVVGVYQLDPVGGVEGRMRYSDLILYNAKVFAKALR
ncbi:MAG: metal ABC transporter substrate-binding protein [Bacteroidota bacterium]